MNKMETEFKCLISFEEKENILKYFSNLKCNNILQINYYYDTEDFSFFSNNCTLRIRQKNNKLNLQYKYNKKTINQIRTSDEYSQILSTLPRTISLNGIVTNLQGILITERVKIELSEAAVCIDCNYYMGKTDYELEIESCNEDEIKELVQKLKLRSSNIIGKYSRFVEQLKKLTLNQEILFENKV
jgi:uncharacterized protein YjbK